MIMDRYNEILNTFNKNAIAYQNRFMDMDLYHDTFDHFCDLIKSKKPNILEVGCGPGNISKYILTRLPESTLLGLDFAPLMIELAAENNPRGEFMLMDAREIDRILGEFDAVMCGFCLPYLDMNDCNKLIKDCKNLLQQDGILYLSTMEGDYNSSGYEFASNGVDRCFIHYHQEDYLRKMLNENNFEIVHLFRREFPKHDGTFALDLIIISKLV